MLEILRSNQCTETFFQIFARYTNPGREEINGFWGLELRLAQIQARRGTILQVLTYSYKAVVKYYFKFGELKNKRRKAECWPGKTCRPWNVLFTTRGIDEYV